MALLTDSRVSPTHILRCSQTVQKAVQKAGWILSSGCSDCASSFPSSSSSSPSLPSGSCSLGTLFLQGIRGPDDFRPTHGQLVPSVQGIRGPSDFSTPLGQLVPSVSLVLGEHLQLQQLLHPQLDVHVAGRPQGVHQPLHRGALGRGLHLQVRRDRS